MARRVFVHVGAPKAGTTYLQSVLFANQQRLAEAGMLLPGEVRFDHNRVAQAVRTDRPNRQQSRTWNRILGQIRDWPGDALISNEWITMATPAQSARMVERLQPTEVHIVYTARNLLAAVPSAWQQRLKVGLSQPLDGFVDGLDSEPTTDDRWSWSNLDPVLALQRWESVPAEHVHIVTVPQRGGDPDLLWTRFAFACGIAPDVCDLSQASGNESLDAESARLLQLTGRGLRAAINADNAPWRRPHTWIRFAIADRVLVPFNGHKIALAEHQVERLRSRAEHGVAQLRDADYDVVGDLDELTRDVLPPSAIRPEDADPAEMIERAGAVMAALLRQARKERRRADRNAERVRELERQLTRQPNPPTSTRAARVRSRLRMLTRRAKRALAPGL